MKELSLAVTDRESTKLFISQRAEDVEFGKLKLQIMKRRVLELADRLADLIQKEGNYEYIGNR